MKPDQPSNVININPQHNDVVQVLEGLLESARRGEVTSFFASYVVGDNQESRVRYSRAGTFPTPYALTTLIGSMEDHKMIMLDRLRYLDSLGASDDPST